MFLTQTAQGGQQVRSAGVWEERWRRAAAGFAGDDAGRSVLLHGDGVTVTIEADTVRPGASVLKLFVAIAAHVAGPGDVDLATTVAVRDLPVSRWPSMLAALSDDHRFTTAELAALMLATSDNRVAEHLVTTIGYDRVNDTAHALGCTSTELRVGFGDDALDAAGRANVTTAADCAVAIAAIGCRPELAPLRPALASSLFNSRILSKLPDDVIVSHKTGSLAGVVNDVGVVHAPAGDFTACFLTDAQSDPAATSAAIGQCALDAYLAWQDR